MADIKASLNNDPIIATLSGGDTNIYVDASTLTPAQLAQIKGPKGDTGNQGTSGAQGPRGLAGPKGEAFKYSDFTPEQLEALKGQDGTVSFDQLTAEQVAMLKGDDGEPGPYFVPFVSENGDLAWSNSAGLNNPATVNIRGPMGLKGQDGTVAFDDLTEDQLNMITARIFMKYAATTDGPPDRDDEIFDYLEFPTYIGFYSGHDSIAPVGYDKYYWCRVGKGEDGNGISSISKISTSGLVDTYAIDYTDGTRTTFNVNNGEGIDYSWSGTSLGIKNQTESSYSYVNLKGDKGDQGERGYYFTPTVSSSGNISWTNNGGLSNPTTVNIKGPQGEQGIQGPQGIQGIQGYSGVHYGDTAPTDTDVVWVQDVNYNTDYNFIIGRGIKRIELVDEYPTTSETDVLYIKYLE